MKKERGVAAKYGVAATIERSIASSLNQKKKG